MLVRESGVDKDGQKKYDAVTGTKDKKTGKPYRWLESEMVYELKMENDIDRSYFDKMVDEAADTIAK